MNKKIGIYIFRRDLRLDDNHGLLNLSKNVDIILPVFFLDPYQIIKSDHNKYYFSNNAVQFMCESLIDLNNQLKEKKSKLRLFYGEPHIMLENIIKQFDNNIIIGWNTDFSEYSKKRDNKLLKICQQYNLSTYITESDYSLISLNNYLNKNNNPYKQFGAFYKNAIKNKPTQPVKYTLNNFISDKFKINHEFDKKLNTFYQLNKNIAQHGGRSEALIKLNNLQYYKDYNKMRDILSYNTTNLSAALNFGCISIREVYYHTIKKLTNNNLIIKQLYWRDFFLQAVKNIPFASSYQRHMDERYDKIKWKNSKIEWEIMLNAKTGFLLIDAGINEMKISGFLHNRARMLVGIFWTKYLQINTLHPKYGSQVGYSQFLVDAVGASQNKLNHAWLDEFDFPGKKYSAPGAPLSGRPMDISNKMIKKWDPTCQYIKKWLPNLVNIPNQDLIKWNDDIAKKYNYIHPAPMFDPKIKYQEWIKICKHVTH